MSLPEFHKRTPLTPEELAEENSPEKMAFRKGFLYGLYEGWKEPHELATVCPYPAGSSEAEAWIKGFYNNL